jgi:hypothetical protein
MRRKGEMGGEGGEGAGYFGAERRKEAAADAEVAADGSSKC